jgi:hypothetical protein
LLAARGYTPGRDLRVVVEIASHPDHRLEEKARALLAVRPDVLVAWGAGNINVLSSITRTVPIVCGGTADPVGIGYAKSIRRPGGNITGLSLGVPEMAPIIVGLMQAVRPHLKRIAAVVAGTSVAPEGWPIIIGSLEAAARMQSIDWQFTPVASLGSWRRCSMPSSRGPRCPTSWTCRRQSTPPRRSRRWQAGSSRARPTAMSLSGKACS